MNEETTTTIPETAVEEPEQIEIIQEATEEVQIYSEITSEPLTIIADEAVETSVTETEIMETTTSTTLIDYQAEIYKNTKVSAECLAFLSGSLIIISAILICVVISKVFIDY